MGGALNSLHDARCDVIVNRNLDLNFRNEIHHVFGTAINFGLTLLTTKALDLAHGQALDAERHERRPYFFKFKGFDDGHDKLHRLNPHPYMSSPHTARLPTYKEAETRKPTC